MANPAESVIYGALNLNATLAQTPMLMAHNAATIYIPEGSFFQPTNLYIKNQDKDSDDKSTRGIGVFSDLLNCGARALEIEINIPDDPELPVGFQHGSFGIAGITLQAGLTDIKSWSDKYPQELVLLSTDCPATAEKCSSRVLDVFKDSKIEFIDDCAMIQTMTVDEAMKKGPVVAVSNECIKQNYDIEQTCYGALPSTPQEKIQEVIQMFGNYNAGSDGVSKFIAEYENIKATLNPFLAYSCLDGDEHKDIPVKSLLNHLEKVRSEHSLSQDLWQMQGLWQIGNLTTILGLNQPRPLPASVTGMKPSSIKNDVEKSNVNKLVYDFIQKNDPTDFSLVTMDFICNEYGTKIIGALRPTSETKAPTSAPASTSEKINGLQNLSIFAIASSLAIAYFS